MKRRMMLIGMALLVMCGLMGCGMSDVSEIERENVLLSTGEIDSGADIDSENGSDSESSSHSENSSESVNSWGYIDGEGMTLETRVRTPEGYSRTAAEENSLTSFLRTYPMKADGSEVLLYNGSPKGNQWAHAAVFALPIEAENLQQCADSVMRVYAEYCWHTGQAEKLSFHLTNGFLAEYSKWRDGQRISVNGNEINWTDSVGYDDSYECFKKYLRMVFAYAGTLSMDTYEAEPITLEELQVGDVFLKGGSPGHVVMVVDICENGEGEKAFLLGQGYMPAQEFQVIKNPAHLDDPWYYEDEVTYPFRTAEYTFSEGSLKRLSYLSWTESD